MGRRMRKPSRALLSQLTSAKHMDWRRKRTKQQGGLCYWCGKVMRWPTLDHLVPLSRDGADHWENVVAACEPCNKAKGDLLPAEFRPSDVTAHHQGEAE